MANKQEGTTDRNEMTSQLYTISNIAHAEYHLIEIMVNNEHNLCCGQHGLLETQIKKLRKMRSDMMKDIAKDRPAMNGLWCVMKHLIMVEMHFWELYEKRVGEQITEVYLDRAKEIHLMIDELLAEDALGDLEDCPRCEDDKKK